MSSMQRVPSCLCAPPPRSAGIVLTPPRTAAAHLHIRLARVRSSAGGEKASSIACCGGFSTSAVDREEPYPALDTLPQRPPIQSSTLLRGPFRASVEAYRRRRRHCARHSVRMDLCPGAPLLALIDIDRPEMILECSGPAVEGEPRGLHGLWPTQNRSPPRPFLSPTY